MAEFCLDCWNKINGVNDPPGKYVLSRELDICEECGEWKPVIIRIKRSVIIGEWFRERISHFAKDMGN
ncbi:MAG: hypothetical protein ACI3XG_08640 [Faecousia sp.]